MRTVSVARTQNRPLLPQHVVGKGTAVLHVTSTDGKRGTIVLRNVLHVPAISYNLLALNLVAKASKDAHVVIKDKESAIAFGGWSVPLVPADNHGHLYLHCAVSPALPAALSAGESTTSDNDNDEGDRMDSHADHHDDNDDNEDREHDEDDSDFPGFDPSCAPAVLLAPAGW